MTTAATSKKREAGPASSSKGKKRKVVPPPPAAVEPATPPRVPERRDTQRRMHNCGRVVLLPFLVAIEKRLHADFGDEISRARLSASLYSVCDNPKRTRVKRRRKTAYLFYHMNVRNDVKDSMTEASGTVPSMREVYAEVGRRWGIAKKDGTAQKYYQMEQEQEAEDTPAPAQEEEGTPVEEEEDEEDIY